MCLLVSKSTTLHSISRTLLFWSFPLPHSLEPTFDQVSFKPPAHRLDFFQITRSSPRVDRVVLRGLGQGFLHSHPPLSLRPWVWTTFPFRVVWLHALLCNHRSSTFRGMYEKKDKRTRQENTDEPWEKCTRQVRERALIANGLDCSSYTLTPTIYSFAQYSKLPCSESSIRVNLPQIRQLSSSSM